MYFGIQNPKLSSTKRTEQSASCFTTGCRLEPAEQNQPDEAVQFHTLGPNGTWKRRLHRRTSENRLSNGCN